jgi:hypothetical protein
LAKHQRESYRRTCHAADCLPQRAVTLARVRLATSHQDDSRKKRATKMTSAGPNYDSMRLSDYTLQPHVTKSTTSSIRTRRLPRLACTHASTYGEGWLHAAHLRVRLRLRLQPRTPVRLHQAVQAGSKPSDYTEPEASYADFGTAPRGGTFQVAKQEADRLHETDWPSKLRACTQSTTSYDSASKKLLELSRTHLYQYEIHVRTRTAISTRTRSISSDYDYALVRLRLYAPV